jgi:hypothetical protein
MRVPSSSRRKLPASTCSPAASAKRAAGAGCSRRFVQGRRLRALPLNGGFTVLELPTYEDAIVWAARIAKACRCEQELRVFQFDPVS